MASLLAILLFGTISINGQIPPPQFPGQQQPGVGTGPVIQNPNFPMPPIPAPTPPPPPPPGYQGIGCPNAGDACPLGQYRYDAVTIGTAVYGCFCTCPYTLARDCPSGTMIFNWDTCSCDHTPPPTTAAPTTAAPTTGRPTLATPAPVMPQVPAPGQGTPGWVQPPGPPIGGPGPYPVYPGQGPGVPAPGGWLPPGVPQNTLATTWAPGPYPGTLETGAPMDELCGADPFNVLSFKRVGNRITMVMECVPTTTTLTPQSSTSTSAPIANIAPVAPGPPIAPIAPVPPAPVV